MVFFLQNFFMWQSSPCQLVRVSKLEEGTVQDSFIALVDNKNAGQETPILTFKCCF